MVVQTHRRGHWLCLVVLLSNNAIILCTIVGTPTVPVEFKSTEVTSNTITVSWISPSATDENNTDIEHKLSWYRNQNDILVHLNSTILSSNITSYTIKNLTSDFLLCMMLCCLIILSNSHVQGCHFDFCTNSVYAQYQYYFHPLQKEISKKQLSCSMLPQ